MFFLLQKENGDYDIDNFILCDLLKKNRFIHSYTNCSLEELTKDTSHGFLDSMKNYIPLGTVEFVETYFKKVYGIDHINPIEVPPCLRTAHFLNRKYSIVTYDKIPVTGNYFIKDASRLKQFAPYAGEISMFLPRENGEIISNGFSPLIIEKDHLYQVSECVDIRSEYRIYFLNGSICACANYNGDIEILPDFSVINQANAIYSVQKYYPKSYTMDVMIDASGRRTSIIEIHPMFSCGLYTTLLPDSFLYAYSDAKNYVLNINHPPTEFLEYLDGTMPTKTNLKKGVK